MLAMSTAGRLILPCTAPYYPPGQRVKEDGLEWVRKVTWHARVRLFVRNKKRIASSLHSSAPCACSNSSSSSMCLLQPQHILYTVVYLLYVRRATTAAVDVYVRKNNSMCVRCMRLLQQEHVCLLKQEYIICVKQEHVCCRQHGYRYMCCCCNSRA